MGDEVINLSVTPVGTKQRVAVSTRNSLLCLWDALTLNEAANEPIDRYVDTIFLASGLLVSLSENGKSVCVRNTGSPGNFDQPYHFTV